MPRRVCVALDESPASHRALSWALDYVLTDDVLTLVTASSAQQQQQQHDAPLTSSLSPPSVSFPLTVEDDDDDDDDVDDRDSLPETTLEDMLLLDGKLVALQSGKLEPEQVIVHLLVKHSRLAGLGELIVRFANETHQDVLVIGNRSFESRRWKLLPHANLGRVSEYCVKHADRTAVVVVGTGPAS